MRLHKTLDYEVDVLEHQFNRNHIETLMGLATFVGPHEVEVATEAGETTRLTGGPVFDRDRNQDPSPQMGAVQWLDYC